ncbi:hypothetical protein ACUN22_26810 [Streptomyces anulatus]|uniref:hypothetical protein n=1 Tax=Streptomyces anulatus TaxID=1892 RepID=UPI00403E13D3
MTAAHPDHFLIQALPDGRQEVIETTGGSPLPSRFVVDYADLSTLVTPADSAADAEAAGVAISGNAHLCVEFPRTTLPRILSEHRRHLAIEFGNWVESALVLQL